MLYAWLRNIALLVVLTCSAAAAQGAATFIELGALSGGAGRSEAKAVDDRGEFVVGNSSNSGGAASFRWTEPDGIELLSSDLFVQGLSGNGSTVVGSTTNESTGFEEPSFWTQSGGLTLLGLPAREVGTSNSIAMAVSATGEFIAGHVRTDGPMNAFRWTSQGGFQMLGVGADFVTSISASGEVVVGGSPAFRWTPTSGLSDLAALSGSSDQLEAYTVSNDGAVIFGAVSSSLGNRVFRWSEGEGLVLLDPFNESPSFSIPAAATERGEAIVGQMDVLMPGAISNEAFVWTETGGAENLQEVLEARFGLADELSGWDLFRANDISSDGRHIVGVGTNPNGVTEGWLVRLDIPIFVPEPGGIVLISLLITAAITESRKRG